MAKKTTLLLMLCLLASCSRNDARDQPKAPEGKPVALDPNPPMSSSELDAIINQHVQRNTPAPEHQKEKRR